MLIGGLWVIKLIMPHGAYDILLTLQEAGYEAYAVGGCVRDSLLGLTPKDWDICTSAKPDEIIKCFHDKRIIETGLKHGTVTVVNHGRQYEVTTFRIDGEYSDNRHPDSVRFVSDIVDDLSRRDFTMNAIAYNNLVGLVDPFNGLSDIIQRKICCVRCAEDRFNEDALRIMRALRFASVYGFEIEKYTAESIHKNVHLLRNIAAERITSELSKMLCGKGLRDILLEYSDVMSEIIPELKPCVGFDQNNKYHCYTVYDHIAVATSNYVGGDVAVKMALLLHDIGKPCCYTEDHNGGHFHGHGVYSHDLAKTALSGLRFDNKTTENILELILYHDATLEPTPKVVRRWLNKIGIEQFERLLAIRFADITAHSPGTQQSRIDKWSEICAISNEVSSDCFTLKDLAINGRDLIAMGIPQGKRIGEILNNLLLGVMDDYLTNDKECLLQHARKLASDLKLE